MRQHPQLMKWGMEMGVGEREKQPQMNFSSTPPQGTANLVAQTLQEPAEKWSSCTPPHPVPNTLTPKAPQSTSGAGTQTLKRNSSVYLHYTFSLSLLQSAIYFISL